MAPAIILTIPQSMYTMCGCKQCMVILQYVYVHVHVVFKYMYMYTILGLLSGLHSYLLDKPQTGVSGTPPFCALYTMRALCVCVCI